MMPAVIRTQAARRTWCASVMLSCLLAPYAYSAEPSSVPTADDTQRGFSLVLGTASDYAVHGLSRSLAKPVINAQLGYGLGHGWQLAANGSTMNLNRGPGPTRELALYLGNRRAISEDWEVGGNLARYEFWKNTSFLPYDYTEATVEAIWRSMVKMRLQYSPDYSIVARRQPARDFTTFTGELEVNYAFRPGLQGAVALGYYDLSAGIDAGYFFWTVGAVASRGRVSLALSYVGVDGTAKAMFNSRITRDKLIATLAWRAY
jgi:uncharacterized protein (TIGR02001 family)